MMQQYKMLLKNDSNIKDLFRENFIKNFLLKFNSLFHQEQHRALIQSFVHIMIH